MSADQNKQVKPVELAALTGLLEFNEMTKSMTVSDRIQTGRMLVCELEKWIDEEQAELNGRN